MIEYAFLDRVSCKPEKSAHITGIENCFRAIPCDLVWDNSLCGVALQAQQGNGLVAQVLRPLTWSE